LDQFLLARGGQIDLIIAAVGISVTDPGNEISIQVAAKSDPRILDQEIVELVAELDELLFGFCLLGLDHESSIGAEGGQGNS
jgi:hypothetical protein